MAHVAGAAKRPAERSDDVTRPAPGREPAQVNSRSCVTCRHRKVRCGRSNPCSNCVKAGIDCVFPTARRESRKAPDAELVARLKGLESALGRLVNDHPGGQQGHDPPSAAHGYSDGCHWNSSPTDGNSSARCSEPVGKNLGRFLVNEGQTQYVSESFWANTCDEVCTVHRERDLSSDPALGHRDWRRAQYADTAGHHGNSFASCNPAQRLFYNPPGTFPRTYTAS